jgi:hypothetical protein
MFINIITPCSRPQNLWKISKSINIPKDCYRWIVVFDGNECEPRHIPHNCEYYFHTNPTSVVGNDQRNFAIDKVSEGYLYFNDDDTELHPELWNTVNNMDYDFIHFSQIDINGNLRLRGNEVGLYRIDSHNFMVSLEVVGNTRWVVDRYDADGHFATTVYKNSKSPYFVNKVLSIYNSLRPVYIKL